MAKQSSRYTLAKGVQPYTSFRGNYATLADIQIVMAGLVNHIKAKLADGETKILIPGLGSLKVDAGKTKKIYDIKKNDGSLVDTTPRRKIRLVPSPAITAAIEGKITERLNTLPTKKPSKAQCDLGEMGTFIILEGAPEASD